MAKGGVGWCGKRWRRESRLARKDGRGPERNGVKESRNEGERKEKVKNRRQQKIGEGKCKETIEKCWRKEMKMKSRSGQTE